MKHHYRRRSGYGIWAGICLLLSTSVWSQKITNELTGYFKATTDTTLYSYFAFDGNGKVDIVGLGDGDYFQIGDSVIVYPDKSILKFVLKDNRLYGASEWLNGGVWEYVKDTVIETKRVNPAASDRIAGLLHKYYTIREQDQWAGILHDDSTFTIKMNQLCDSGLSKACLDCAGLKIMEDMGGVEAILSGKAVVKKKANPEILSIINKAIHLGDHEGYVVLGAYYVALENMQKAREVFDQGIKLGCKRCGLAAMALSMEAQQKEKSAAQED